LSPFVSQIFGELPGVTVVEEVVIVGFIVVLGVGDVFGVGDGFDFLRRDK
jgi:hypothetical protein